MAKSDFCGLSTEVFISLAPSGLSANMMLESVISIYNHYWWWMVLKTCNIPVESWKQVKMTFIFSRLILKTVYGQKDYVWYP